MKRQIYGAVILLGFLIGMTFTPVLFKESKAANEGTLDKKPSPEKKKKNRPVKINVVPWGADQATVARAKRDIELQPEVQKELRGTKYRLMSFDLIDSDFKGKNKRTPPTRYSATFYDYTNNRTIKAEGALDNSEPVKIREHKRLPVPNEEEFEEAINIVRQDPELGPKVHAGKLVPYQPMPPIVYPETVGEKIDRIVNVGLEAIGNGAENQIVGVNMNKGTVVRFPDNAPVSAKVTAAGCGIPSGAGSNGRGLAGSYQMTVTQGQTELWSMTITRPSSSSGDDGSGIELVDVKYRGKMVLKRAHIPILNVRYVSSCGPFRDWQYNENGFKINANSNNVAPGISITPTPAITIVDDRDDSGSFRGIAIYTQGEETILVTEMSAGWYRYLNEWRFANDGTIRPRYAFGSTTSSCVCIERIHHAYWRLDFDLNGANNSISQVLISRSFQKQRNLIATEVKQYRAPNMHWLITNPSTGDTYMIMPGDKDGTAQGDSYGKGDAWILRYKTFPTEVDDSAVYTGSAINIDPFVNNEALTNQDIVFWYAVHVTRSDDTSLTGPRALMGQYVVGPTLRPVRW
jgi:hypothetical protein